MSITEAEKKGAKACLEAHNEKRKFHKDTPKMEVYFWLMVFFFIFPKLSKKLCEQAQEAAEDLARRNAFAHDTEKFVRIVSSATNYLVTVVGKTFTWRVLPAPMMNWQKNWPSVTAFPLSTLGTTRSTIIHSRSRARNLIMQLLDISLNLSGRSLSSSVSESQSGEMESTSVCHQKSFIANDLLFQVLCRYSPAGNYNTAANLRSQVGKLK